VGCGARAAHEGDREGGDGQEGKSAGHGGLLGVRAGNTPSSRTQAWRGVCTPRVVRRRIRARSPRPGAAAYTRSMPFSVPQERKLVTEIPGPKSRALQERRVASVSRGAGTLANIYMERGSGAILVDVDGNQLIDLGCGIGVTTVGHAHPEVA